MTSHLVLQLLSQILYARPNFWEKTPIGSYHLFEPGTGLFPACGSAAFKSGIYSLFPRWEEGRIMRYRMWACSVSRGCQQGSFLTEGTLDLAGNDAQLFYNQLLGKTKLA